MSTLTLEMLEEAERRIWNQPAPKPRGWVCPYCKKNLYEDLPRLTASGSLIHECEKSPRDRIGFISDLGSGVIVRTHAS